MVALAILSGMCFSLVAVAYRLGMPRGIGPLHILGTCAVAGTAVYGLRSLGSLQDGLPPLVVALGLVTGVMQYAMLPLIRAGLRAGPLSPLWCVLMLTFVPVTLYVCLALGERLTPLHYASMGAAALCVVMATMGEGSPSASAEGRAAAPRHRLRYAAILVALLVLNCANGVSVKELNARADGHGVALMPRFSDLYLAMLYAGIAGGVLVDQVVSRRPPPPWRWTLLLGGLATVGSVVGMYLLLRASVLPAAVVFTVNSVSSIFFTALLAAGLLGERRTWSWYASLACGVLAVLLANVQEVVEYIRLGT